MINIDNYQENFTITFSQISTELPVKFSKPLTDQNPMEKNSASFDIALTKPNHKVKWFLNGKELTENDKFHPKQIDGQRFSLLIDDCQLTDDGPIKCVVFNDKDEEVLQSECNLKVKG